MCNFYPEMEADQKQTDTTVKSNFIWKSKTDLDPAKFYGEMKKEAGKNSKRSRALFNCLENWDKRVASAVSQGENNISLGKYPIEELQSFGGFNFLRDLQEEVEPFTVYSYEMNGFGYKEIVLSWNF